jgi:PRTRC genetic system protein A
MKPVGYLINKDGSLEGERGIFYDYILASNGLYIQARNAHLEATILIADAEVRGLAPLEESVSLLHGKMPWHLYDLAYSYFVMDPNRERYTAIVWQDRYRLKVPEQTREQGSVRYFTKSDVVLDIHSHGTMTAWFSTQDDSDEQALRLYMVVGKVNMLIPEMELRIGVYGYFAPISVRDVFGV